MASLEYQRAHARQKCFQALALLRGHSCRNAMFCHVGVATSLAVTLAQGVHDMIDAELFAYRHIRTEQ